MSGTEIIRQTDALPSFEVVGHELDQLEASGDIEALREVSNQADAFQQYEKRAKALDRANYFGRVKVQAEARLGKLDIDSGARTTEPLLIGDTTISQTTRGCWRTLGLGLQLGQLEKAMALVEAADDSVNTAAVARELRDMGVAWVLVEPLRRQYQKLHAKEGLTVAEVARELDGAVSIHHVRDILSRAQPRAKIMRRDKALHLCRVLGVDPSTLRSGKRTNKNNTGTRRRMRQARQLPGGRLDQTYVYIRKALQELDAAAGNSGRWNVDEAWHHLYQAEEIIGKAMKRAAVDA